MKSRILSETTSIKTSSHVEGAKPLLKWAGGKTQLLNEINKRVPQKYNTYVEPFFGGGALFFNIQPESAVIADINPELINLYKTVAKNVQGIIKELQKLKNNEKLFYKVRSLDWTKLTPEAASARTIFLNRTCFNGLYRVNQKGQFNVPFGHYKNPLIIDTKALEAASILFKRATIVCADYKTVIKKYVKKGDFIFLDPPYLPISKYSDFKRYTKESFYEEDHHELAQEVHQLSDLGCYVVLTNSNHPLVHELYKKFDIDVIQTRRYINSNSSKRTGEDVVVSLPPAKKIKLLTNSVELSPQIERFPSTRYMGSKNKLLKTIWNVSANFKFDSVLDLFSGSGIVGYMFKAQGKSVISNDYMSMASSYSKALIENSNVILTDKDLQLLLSQPIDSDNFVATTFKDLYFIDEDNFTIDTIRANIKKVKNPYKKSIAMTALIRACIKKRPRGIFTYVGNRYDDGRKDLKLTLQEQFINAVQSINNGIFDNGKEHISLCGDAMNVAYKADLVYIDPPYYSPLSDNEYVRRYHFVEGLARDWKGIEIQAHTQTKKFKSYPTPFSTRNGAFDAFDKLFKKFSKSILLVSYSSNSLPNMDEMVELLSRYKSHVEVVSVDHKYSFGNQRNRVLDNKNTVQEYLFIGY